MSIKRALVEALNLAPVPFEVLRHSTRVACVVFRSHAVVLGASPPHLKWIVPCKTALRFESDLDWLTSHFRFVSYEDVEAFLAGTSALPAKAALLTFDDGYGELCSIVGPLLRSRSVPALAFLTTSQIDNERLSVDCKTSLCVEGLLNLPRADRVSLAQRLRLSEFVRDGARDGLELREYLRPRGAMVDELWQSLGLSEVEYLRDAAPYLTRQQVGQMASEGWAFGGHATVHRRLQDLTSRELEREVTQSCDIVSSLTGQARTPFAFPYSGIGVRRDWLSGIRSRHVGIGLFFDVRGLEREGSLVWHRIGIEDPGESIEKSVRLAYVRALGRRVTGITA